jgi:hypothetical protein
MPRLARNLASRRPRSVEPPTGKTPSARRRCVFSGTPKKKLGLTLASAKEERGRVYRIAEPASA